jgi:hypothetical protein
MHNYCYPYKAVLNEKLGDGMLSGVNFSTKGDMEVDETGTTFAVITLRGRWYVFFLPQEALHVFFVLSPLCPWSSPCSVSKCLRRQDLTN